MERLKFSEERDAVVVSSEKLRARHVREYNWMELCEQQREGISTAFSRPCVGGETVSQRPRRDAPKSSGTFLPGTRNDVGGCIK